MKKTPAVSGGSEESLRRKCSNQSASHPAHVSQVKRRGNQPERQVQRAVLDHLAWRAPRDIFWCHYPAGGRRSPITGALMKSLGAKPGVPDLLLVSQGRLFGLELKNGTRGRLSDAQIATHSEMRKAGAIIGVAGDLDQALELLATWGILPEAPR
jgi:hypothetical protein